MATEVQVTRSATYLCTAELTDGRSPVRELGTFQSLRFESFHKPFVETAMSDRPAALIWGELSQRRTDNSCVSIFLYSPNSSTPRALEVPRSLSPCKKGVTDESMARVADGSPGLPGFWGLNPELLKLREV